MTETWNECLMRVYKRNHAKDESYKYGQAMKDAQKEYTPKGNAGAPAPAPAPKKNNKSKAKRGTRGTRRSKK